MRFRIFVPLIFAASVAQAQYGGITHVDTVVAPSLAKNLIGDSNRKPITVYLPPSYSKRPYKRYPVVYLLHGFSASHRAFMAGVYSNMDTRLSMDSLIHQGLSKEMIVVTPNADNPFDGGFYRNSVTTGNWEDYIYRDVVNFIDHKYRTVRSRTGRGIAGHSMGGYGALWIGMRHPEVFSAMYLLSPCCLRDFGDVKQRGVAAWKAALRTPSVDSVLRAGFTADLLIALAAVYSPNPSHPPLFVDFPNKLVGDSLVKVPEIEKLWLDGSPMNYVTRYAANLRRMAIAFDAGRQDALKDIPISVTMLDSVLTELKIPHTAEIYDGTHMSRIRSRIETKVIPFMSSALH